MAADDELPGESGVPDRSNHMQHTQPELERGNQPRSRGSTHGSKAVQLDGVSGSHLCEMISQSLASQQLAESVWTETFMSVMDSLAAGLTPAALARLTASRIALWKARAQLPAHSPTREAGKLPLESDLSIPQLDDPTITDRKRALFARARSLLPRDSPPNATADPVELVQPVPAQQADYGPTAVEKAGEEDPTSQPPGDWLPRLSVFCLQVRTSAVTKGAVQQGTAKLGLVFIPGEFDGRPLFGASYPAPPFDPEDDGVLDRLGGTFTLTSTAKEASRLEQVLEMAAFALISLVLEAALLEDFSCARPKPQEAPPRPPPTAVKEDEGAAQLAHLPSEEWAAGAASGAKRVNRRSLNKHSWENLQIYKKGTLVRLRKGRHKENAPLERTHSLDPLLPAERTAPDSITARSTKKKWIGSLFGNKHHRERESSTQSTTSNQSNLSSGWVVDLLSFGSKPAKESTPADEFASEAPHEVENDEVVEEEPTARSARVVYQMSKHKLSTSPDVAIPPPHILRRLCEQEQAVEASTPATADSTTFPAHLTSLGASDMSTFVEDFANGNKAQASATDLRSFSMGTVGSTSSQVGRIKLDVKAGLASLMTNNNSLAGTIRHQGIQFLAETVLVHAPPGTAPCHGPEWQSCRYYGHSDYAGAAADLTVGQMVESLVLNQNEPCGATGCDRPRKEHATVFMHGEEKITLKLATRETDQPAKISSWDDIGPLILSWSSCRQCARATTPRALSAATYSYSWSKLLELVLYDTNFVPSPSLCEHAGVDKSALMRSFALGETVVHLELDPITLFELRLPTAVDPAVDDLQVEHKLSHSRGHVLEEVRGQVSAFYASVSRRLDSISVALGPEGGVDKPPRQRASSAASDKTITDPTEDKEEEHQPGTVTALAHKLALLSALRDSLEDDEQDCYRDLDQLSPTHVNIARSAFLSRAKAAEARLSGWEKSHLAVKLAPASYVEPDYFYPPQHIFPLESAVVVREDELSSIIALTLSAPAFVNLVEREAEQLPSESASLIGSRNVSPGPHQPLHSPSPSRKVSSSRPSIINGSLLAHGSSSAEDPLTESLSPGRSSPRPPSIASSTSSAGQLDPDNLEDDFAPAFGAGCVAKWRKPRRERWIQTLSPKRSDYFSLGSAFFRSPAATPSLAQSSFDLPQPDVTSQPLSETAVEDFANVEQAARTVPSTPKLDPTTGKTPSTPAALVLSTDKQPLVAVSTELDKSFGGTISSTSSSISAASTLSAKLGRTIDGLPADDTDTDSFLASLRGSSHSAAPSEAPAGLSIVNDGEAEKSDSVIGALEESALDPAAGSSKLFAGLWAIPGTFRGKGPRPSPGVLDKGGQWSEHVKFSMTDGHTKFRVTAFYAKRFAALRARCGLSDELFVESLARCTDLSPEGGKSSAAFWITHDKRFIFKELVTKWGQSEREMFLAKAPALLDYLSNLERPSLMAKPLGFYTVKVKNTKTGVTLRKLDLVVLENLFHHHQISDQYDLKGITTRVAKPKAAAQAAVAKPKKNESEPAESAQEEEAEETGGDELAGREKKCEGGVDEVESVEVKPSVGWDHDFVSGSLQKRLLIHPHSKAILRDGLTRDTTFLAEHEHIDYSLLVGVDGAEKEIVIGLIDTFGTYTALKKAENAVKTGLKKALAGQPDEVTVVPPADYSRRFNKTIPTYFPAVPDKWSKPPAAAQDDEPRLACPL